MLWRANHQRLGKKSIIWKSTLVLLLLGFVLEVADGQSEEDKDESFRKFIRE